MTTMTEINAANARIAARRAMRLARQESAREAYVNRTVEIGRLIEKLQQQVAAPLTGKSEINWGNVGDASRAIEMLKRAVGKEG